MVRVTIQWLVHAFMLGSNRAARHRHGPWLTLNSHEKNQCFKCFNPQATSNLVPSFVAGTRKASRGAGPGRPRCRSACPPASCASASGSPAPASAAAHRPIPSGLISIITWLAGSLPRVGRCGSELTPPPPAHSLHTVLNTPKNSAQ